MVSVRFHYNDECMQINKKKLKSAEFPEISEK